MRISDWSSDVCSSDLFRLRLRGGQGRPGAIVIVDSPFRHSGFAFSSERIHPTANLAQKTEDFRVFTSVADSRNTYINTYFNTRRDSKRVVEGKIVPVLDDLGGRRFITNKKHHH